MRFRTRATAGNRWSLWLMLAILVAAPAAAGSEAAPAFAKKPTAVADGDKVRIEFAVSRATDVAVQVEDATGRVVRHLAAGVLGPKPPAPLKADALEQSLPWDRRDDLGQPVDVAAGPFSVRVSLGLRSTFEKMLACDPAHLESVRGLACGPDGNLYVFDAFGETHPQDASTVCKVFSREGKYLRTILPYPANLPDEKLKGVKRLQLPDGSKVPFIYQFETRSFLKGLGDLPCQRPVVTSDGRLGFVGIQEGPRPAGMPGEARFTVVGTDGRVAENPLRTLVSPLTDVGASLTLSPDEQTIFATGVRVGIHPCGPDALFICDVCDHERATWKHTVPTGLVYRFRWDDPQAQVVNNQTPLKEPVSVATDKDDHIYVADAGDNRIIVFRSDVMPSGNEVLFPEIRRARAAAPPKGEVLGEVKIEAPQRIEVHKATGAIYVLSGTKDLELVKINNFRSGQVVARLPVFRLRNASPPTRRPTMALDETSDPPAVWVASQAFYLLPRGRAAASPVRVPDLGDHFGEPTPLLPGLADTMTRPEGMAPMEMSLDRVRDLLYVNHFWRCDLARDSWERLALPPGLGNDAPGNHPGYRSGAAGADGNYYVNQGGGGARVTRLGPDMKMIPFRAPLPPTVSRPEEKQGRIIGVLGDHNSGLTADAFGNVYVVWREINRSIGDVDRARKVRAYDKDGFPRGGKNGIVVDSSVPGIFCVRVDFAGNIYLAAGLRPGTSQLPPGLEGRLPVGPHDPEAVNGVNGYPLIYGSIIKFPPSGGSIRAGNGGVPCNYAYGTPIDVKDAEWIVPGVSTVLSAATPRMQPGAINVCGCELPGIDVDGFGRCFYGDTGRFRVGVLDTAGNEICTFGTYGNQDSAGPALAFGWPQAVAVGDGWAYVGDRLNRRIVRVKLAAAAEATCPVP